MNFLDILRNPSLKHMNTLLNNDLDEFEYGHKAPNMSFTFCGRLQNILYIPEVNSQVATQDVTSL